MTPQETLRAVVEEFADKPAPKCRVCNEPMEVGMADSAGLHWSCHKGDMDHWQRSQTLERFKDERLLILARTLLAVMERCEQRKEAFHEGLFARELLGTINDGLKEME